MNNEGSLTIDDIRVTGKRTKTMQVLMAPDRTENPIRIPRDPDLRDKALFCIPDK